MFVITLRYLKPIEEVDAVLAEHRAYLDTCYQSNDFVCSGPQNPRTGGIIIARTADRKRLEELLARDPFSIHGIADYSIVEFDPIKCSANFKKCL